MKELPDAGIYRAGTVNKISDLPPRLTREELALLWRVSIRTIERREAAGIGPRPMKIGGRVLYRREDVLAWEYAQISRARPEGAQY